MSRSEIITVDQIFNMTDGGYDIFKNELGSVPNRNITSPLRADDKSPSFGVYKYDNLYFFKDQGGSQDSGNAIQFVKLRYNLTFGEAIEKIKQDLQLSKRIKSYTPIVKAGEERVKKEKLIEFDDCPFDKKHAEYWDRIHLPESFLRRKNVFQVKNWAIDKIVQRKLDGELTFGYYAPDINKSKILRINVPKELKWKSSIVNTYLWSYYTHQEKVKDLFVVKSRKDELLFDYLGYKTVSVQNEDAKILINNNIERISNIAENPICCMGSDQQGLETSIEIMNATKWKSFIIKTNICKKHDINDFAGYSEVFNLKQLDNLIKLKLSEWT